MKGKTAAKSALELPHVTVGVPQNYFKHCINQHILSTWQDDWNDAVANKLLSSQSWKIGSPPTGGTGRMKLSCVVPESVIRL